MLREYNQDGYFSIRAYYTNLATTSQRNWKIKLIRDVVLVTTTITTYTTLKKPSIDLLNKISSLASDTIVIDPYLEYIIPNGVTIYRKPKVVDSLAQLLNKYQDLFQD